MAKKEMTLEAAQAIVKYWRVDDFGEFIKLDKLEWQMLAQFDSHAYGISYCVFMELEGEPALVHLNAKHVRLTQTPNFRI